ncbi:MAG: hypothetical protein OXM88_09290 [bacterium]|nr:hypothetical protein [bacterium]
MGRYTTVDQVRQLLRAPGQGKWQHGGVWDDTIEGLIDTVEAAIENLIGASPVDAPAEAAARRYPTPFAGLLLETDWYTGDPTEIRWVRTGGTVGDLVTGWTPEDPESTRRGRRFIRRWAGWPTERHVQVTARWGHPQIPAAVRTAAAQWAARLWHEQAAPLGIVDTEGGIPMRVGTADPRIIRLIRHWMPPGTLIA